MIVLYSDSFTLKNFILKRLIWVPLLAIALFPSCIKDKGCKPKSVQSEVAQMQAFAATNGMSATAHPSGIYYEIISPGNGAVANANSKIVITYTGKLMDGTKFDEKTTPNTTEPWPLNGLIQGWIIGIPLIQEGGRIKLIVPSALGYGCEQYYTIPGNSVLFFDVTLVDVQ
jgi:FKBP-type peptidyl-prolyl cis-trans isomerase